MAPNKSRKARPRKQKQQKRKTSGRTAVATAVVRGRGNYAMDQLRNAITKLEGRYNAAQIRGTTANPTPFADSGEFVGAKYGFGRLGRTVGSLAGQLFGSGDYAIKANSLFSSITPTGTISFAGSDRTTRLRQSEYLGDVISSATAGAFRNTSYPLNPGSATTFPWLSAIALLFERYEFKGLIFEFRSSSGDFNGSSQALGTVFMATDYDPTDAAYASTSTMLQSAYSSSTKTSTDRMLHGVECDPMDRSLNNLYVHSDTSPPTGAELRQTNWGTFQIATTGLAGTSVNVGQLWVHYDVVFLEKQL